MRVRGEIFVGTLLVGIGLLALVSTLLDIDFGSICWPTFFIAIGIWIIVRPRMVSKGTAAHLLFFGDLNRRGEWNVTDQEIWSFITDADLDFSAAAVPEGETSIKLYGFIGDLEVTLPAEVGFEVSAYGFVIDAHILDEKKTGFFLQSLHKQSENYATAAKKISIDMLAFVGDLKIRQA